ncbi:MAG TPA: acyl-CoA dehydrogenase family protein [Acidimicrobiales bacterium]|nr:acyl-CoA dehydrogenase family protein [Acidimicrobiales bacterium]
MTAPAGELDRFRARAAGWLAGNMPPAPPGWTARAAMASDEVDRFSRQRMLQRRLFEGGFAGVSFPRAYGGHGLAPEFQRAFADEAIGYEMPVRFSMPTLGIIGATLLEFGTEEQKRRHLPAMLRGDELWVQFLSEPSCGSDLAGAVTTAVRDGDTWIVRGSKVWSSAAYGCDYALLLARTDWDVPKHQGLTMFIVPTDAPGLDLRRIRQVDGSREFCEEFFDDVALPAEAVVGGVNDGWTVAARLLSHERDSVGGGSPYIGNVLGHQAAVPPGPRLAAAAVAAGWAGDGRARQLVGEAHVLSTVATALVGRIAAGTRAGAYRGPAGAVLKLYRATSAMRVATIGLELAGPAGVIGPSNAGVEFLMRQSGSLAGGSNEMQRNLIAERLLGMPSEYAPDRGVPFSQVRRSG